RNRSAVLSGRRRFEVAPEYGLRFGGRPVLGQFAVAVAAQHFARGARADPVEGMPPGVQYAQDLARTFFAPPLPGLFVGHREFSAGWEGRAGRRSFGRR